ncbi:D-aminoacylase [bacterium]|nr:D-aminoacylase [bacterium]
MKKYDVILRNGTIYDGGGGPAIVGDVAISGDRIAAVGQVHNAAGKTEIDVEGLAVAPGFINILSWAPVSLIVDGRSQGNIRQGVTLEVVGEGSSMGPLSPTMKKNMQERQNDIKFDVAWNTLGEYLEHMERRGISTNLASFVGATTVRVNEVGYEDRAPTAAELDRMRELVREAMREGAVGMSTALIYAPACYAKTDELIELCKVVAEHDGLYISHIRSEGDEILTALEEFFTIAREATVRSEIYHLKVMGKHNWHLMDEVIKRVEAERARGLAVTADMYTYPANGTGLNATMPPWVQEGGFPAWHARLKDPEIRKRVAAEMRAPSRDWENILLLAGSPERVLLVDLKKPENKPLIGKTLADVARLWSLSPEEAAMELVVRDETRVECVYFTMSEDNVRRQVALPWVCFGSDAPSMAPEGVFLKSSTHPRAYGTFARVLGKYVRDERVMPMEKAIRKLAALPADSLRLDRRGRLAPDYFADVVVFDPLKVQDYATFENPHQYSTGFVHVFVNGGQVLRDGEHTDARPGRVVRGPGWVGQRAKT